MYLTSSRPDIMIAVCACARFQVNPKVSHLHVVKRIFRYLKGQPKLGLWYPKDSPFDLVAYTDSDYAGASLDRKSTTGDCQFLGCRLILWQCKKQTVVANSTTEAEIVVDSANEFSSTMASAVICLATNQKFNFSKYIFDNMVKNLEGGVKFLIVFANMKRQGKDFSSRDTPLFPTMIVQVQEQNKIVPEEKEKDTEDLNGEDRLKQMKLMELCTKLSERVLALETTKTNQALEINRLKRRVKMLEKKKGSRTHRLIILFKVGRSAQVVSSEDEGLGDQEDASKQGRKIDEIDQDAEVTLVDET
ncbi:hypothetical protein Tco_0277010 [Tanacetum coccineum]